MLAIKRRIWNGLVYVNDLIGKFVPASLDADKATSTKRSGDLRLIYFLCHLSE